MIEEQQLATLPIYYAWKHVPSGLHTKTQLHALRYALPENTQPSALFHDRLHKNAEYPLYLLEDACPMPPKAERQAKDYASLFSKRYTSKRAAYLDASSACFNMNRYAKHATCTYKHREAIYALKNRWIAALYQQGFCIEAVRMVSTRDAKVCFGCEGTGYDEEGERCYRCGGSGLFKPMSTREYWAFRFMVDGQSFAWHQPAPLTFIAQPIGEQLMHEVLAELKPVALPPHKFAEAKALIHWCLESEN